MNRRISIAILGSAAAAIASVAACSTSSGSDVVAQPDASAPDASDADAIADVTLDTPVDVSPDASEDADAAPPVLKRFSGHVDYGGPVANALVTLLTPSADTTTTDSNGDFFFYAPLGSVAIVKVEAPNLYPMIRGIVIRDVTRIRNFYLAGPPEQQAASTLGHSFDVSKGVVEVDFRNATIGGYTATMHDASGGGSVTPGFGIAFDAMGNPVESLETVTGGDGTTLLFGDVPPATVSFTPSVPDAAALPCKPCDAPALPVQAGVVTWFDFECGSATDCE